MTDQGIILPHRPRLKDDGTILFQGLPTVAR